MFMNGLPVAVLPNQAPGPEYGRGTQVRQLASSPMRTQVGIIGGGPAGLLLSQILHRNGVESVVLERRSREYVLGRIRAGVLEWGSVEVLRNAGVGERLDREGRVHDGSRIAWAGRRQLFIDTRKYAGRPMVAYGQTQITEDLYAARDAMGGGVIDEAEEVTPHGVDTGAPWLTYRKDDREHRVDCDFIAGCDGFHGASRQAIPPAVLRTYEKVYPFGWLGILSRTPPLDDIVYAAHDRGFALASQRSPVLSRYYVQCSLDDRLEGWPDERFWEELKARFPGEIAERIVTGPSIEKSIAPLRSFVAEPMRHGRLFLGRGRRAHRPADRRQGAQSRDLGHPLPVARPDRVLCHGLDPLPRRVFRHGAWKGVGRGPVLLVADDAAAPFPRPDGVRPPHAGGRARLHRVVRARAAGHVRAVRGPAVRIAPGR